MIKNGSWPHGARLAMSFVVAVEEGSEMNPKHGDAVPDPVDEFGVALRSSARNYPNESNYLYGIQAGAPRILDLLGQFEIKATFAATAHSLELFPELTQRIVLGGHEICAHGLRWIHQYRMSESDERAFIKDTVASIVRSTGSRPAGWISRYLFTPHTRQLLRESGFTYHMDDYSSDCPFWDYDGTPLLIVPYALDTNDMKMWTNPALTPRQWLDYAIDTFDWLYREGSSAPRMMSIGLHLRIIGRPGRVGALEKFIKHVQSHDAVWVATRKQIAEWWTAANPPIINRQ